MITLMMAMVFACNKPNVMTSTIRGVDSIFTEQRYLDVYCPSGICQFSVQYDPPTQVHVSMYYETNEPFTKIEGAQPLKGRAAITIVNSSQFTVRLNNPKPLQIQVVDYFRN